VTKKKTTQFYVELYKGKNDRKIRARCYYKQNRKRKMMWFDISLNKR